MPTKSVSDLEREYYIAQLGLTTETAVGLSINDLRNQFFSNPPEGGGGGGEELPFGVVVAIEGRGTERADPSTNTAYPPPPEVFVNWLLTEEENSLGLPTNYLVDDFITVVD